MGPSRIDLFLPLRNSIRFQIAFVEGIQQLAKFKTVSMNPFICWLHHCPSMSKLFKMSLHFRSCYPHWELNWAIPKDRLLDWSTLFSPAVCQVAKLVPSLLVKPSIFYSLKKMALLQTRDICSASVEYFLSGFCEDVFRILLETIEVSNNVLGSKERAIKPLLYVNPHRCLRIAFTNWIKKLVSQSCIKV